VIEIKVVGGCRIARTWRNGENSHCISGKEKKKNVN